MKSGAYPVLMAAILDFIYIIVLTAAFSVFVFHYNSGKFRMFILLPCVAGFALYHSTVGRLVMAVSEAIVSFIRRAVGFVVIRPLGWLWRMTGARIVQLISRTLMKRRHERIARKSMEQIKFEI